MSYEIVLSPEAEADLAALSPLVQSALIEELERLGRSPVARSRPSFFPWLPGYQLFDPRFACEGEVHYCVVLFKYAASEQALWVHAIAHHVLPSG